MRITVQPGVVTDMVSDPLAGTLDSLSFSADHALSVVDIRASKSESSIA
jgi:hypothetical protein